MEANASITANHTVASIEREVSRMLAEAAATDAEEDRLHGIARGDELPAELQDRGGRLARLARAKARLQDQQHTSPVGPPWRRNGAGRCGAESRS